MSSSPRSRHIYFPAVGIFLFILSLIAFSDNLLTDIGQPSNSDPKFLVHAAFAFVWFGFLAIQPVLVARGKLETHKRIGVYGFAAASGLVLSTIYIRIVLVSESGTLAGLALLNSILMAFSVIGLVFAYRYRVQPEVHKRLVIISTFFILFPITDSVGGNLGISPFIVSPLIILGLFLSLIAHDAIRLRKFPVLASSGLALMIAALVVVPL